jgi:hypothetical protein
LIRHVQDTMAIPVIHVVGLPKNHVFDAKLQYTA